MTSILRQDNSGLNLYVSEREFPVKENYESNFSHLDRIKKWFEDACSYPVFKPDKDKFIETAMNMMRSNGFHEAIIQGILIPSNCYEIGTLSPDPEELEKAFFKSPDKVEEKESEAVEWPTDEFINSQDLTPSEEFQKLNEKEKLLSHHSFRAGAKWMREYFAENHHLFKLL